MGKLSRCDILNVVFIFQQPICGKANSYIQSKNTGLLNGSDHRKSMNVLFIYSSYILKNNYENVNIVVGCQMVTCKLISKNSLSECTLLPSKSQVVLTIFPNNIIFFEQAVCGCCPSVLSCSVVASWTNGNQNNFFLFRGRFWILAR